MDDEFGLGPQWARGTTCCGKPVGCTNMSDQCLMKNHPWKRRYIAWEIAGFIAARLAEDEAAANAVDDHYSAPCTYNAWLVDIARGLNNLARPGVAEHIARHDPARALREVEAKRAILRRHAPDGSDLADCLWCSEDERSYRWPCPDVLSLAAVYSDHPQYQPGWALAQVSPGRG